MNQNRTLQAAYTAARYPVPGHGPRNVQVMKDALADIDGSVASDIYGKGTVIEDFQAKMAAFLGKEDAVFFPSGTMAQQIALRIWCDRTGLMKVAYHPLCHLEIHEQDGLKELHHIQPVLLGDADRLIELADLEAQDQPITCLLLELPQREIGGQLPSYESVVDIADYCKATGMKLHLDGARLLEVLPYYQKSAAEICALFDSVYLSFYKGLGGIAGAVLAGDRDFIAESIVWKRRHGGDLISLYPYILSADYYFSQRKDKMEQYYQGAKEIASLFNACADVTTLPKVPVSNMFHVWIKRPLHEAEAILIQVYEETGVAFSPSLRARSEAMCSFELSVGDAYARISPEVLHDAFAVFANKLSAST